MGERDWNDTQSLSARGSTVGGKSRPRREMIMSHRFVEFVPQEIEPEVIYISMEYATAIHLCACGCGQKVVTPFVPSGGGWTLLFDGEAVTLSPSIGNWSFACQSHYFIRNNHIVWAREARRQSTPLVNPSDNLGGHDLSGQQVQHENFVQADGNAVQGAFKSLVGFFKRYF